MEQVAILGMITEHDQKPTGQLIWRKTDWVKFIKRWTSSSVDNIQLLKLLVSYVVIATSY